MQAKPIQDSTRDRLVEAARELFWKRGYTATGIAEVLKAANARAGSLYYFFPTKEDLLVAVLDKYTDMLGPFVLGPAFSRVSDPVERVFAILDGYRRQLEATNFEHGCPIGSLALELSNGHERARVKIGRNFELWLEAVQRCFDDAQGRLPQGTDTRRLAMLTLTSMEGAVMLARTFRSVDAYDDAITGLRDYIDRLLADGTTWDTKSKSSRKAPKQPSRQTRRRATALTTKDKA